MHSCQITMAAQCHRFGMAFYGLVVALLLCMPLRLSANILYLPDDLYPVALPNVDAEAWLLLDAESGYVLAAKKPHQVVEPASLTKLMTAMLVFDELKRGQLTLDTRFVVSEKAWKMGGSRMFLEANSSVRLEDLLKGLIVQSGNDAAVALAEGVSGSTDAFAKRMNERARQLAMQESHFMNPSGWPEEGHQTSVDDLARLTLALLKTHPDYYPWYSLPSYSYNGIDQPNRNVLLNRNIGVDGVKTGFTKSAGYCLIGSAKRDNRRLVALVVGSSSERARADAVQELLEFGFKRFKNILFERGRMVAEVGVRGGDVAKLSLGLSANHVVPVPVDHPVQVTLKPHVDQFVQAPLAAESVLGVADLMVAGKPIGTAGLMALHAVELGPWWRRIIDNVKRVVLRD